MLVLSRKVGESILIDNCIRVTVTEVDRNRVRLGITAPPHVQITREELVARLREFAEQEEVCV